MMTRSFERPEFDDPLPQHLSHVGKGELETQKLNSSLALMVLYGVVQLCRTDVRAIPPITS